MYQHGRKVRRPKNYMVLLASAAVLGIASVISWAIIHRDINSQKNDVAGAAVITNVAAEKSTRIKIDEPLFSMELPADWKQTQRINEPRLNVWIWRSTKKGSDASKLELYVDTLPEKSPIVRLQPVSLNGQKLLVGPTSDDCVNFSGSHDQKKQGTAPFSAKWQGITFLCDPVSANHTIGTGSLDGGSALLATGSDGKQHAFYFIYTDHNSRPDPSVFRTVLSSFTLK